MENMIDLRKSSDNSSKANGIIEKFDKPTVNSNIEIVTERKYAEVVVAGKNSNQMIKVFVFIIVVLFVAISYQLHQNANANLVAWYSMGGLMVLLRTIRAIQLIKLKQ